MRPLVDWQKPGEHISVFFAIYIYVCMYIYIYIYIYIYMSIYLFIYLSTGWAIKNATKNKLFVFQN